MVYPQQETNMGMAHAGLAKLAEELGELQQVIGKALQVGGLDRPHWSGRLSGMFEVECGDVLAAMRYVLSNNACLNEERIHTQAEEKLALFYKWSEEDAPATGATVAPDTPAG
jgi:hypothetical protein